MTVIPSSRKARFSSTALLEELIKGILAFLAAVPLLVTLILIGLFGYEAFNFFQSVADRVVEDPDTFQLITIDSDIWQGLVKFFTDTVWNVDQAEFGSEQLGAGIVVLVVATLIVSGIALVIAIPLGILSAIYLAEYAPPWLRLLLKPALEAISGIPTVVLGYFGFLTLTPVLQTVLPDIAPQNGLSAGIVIGFFLIPTISSLTEDALRAVPNELRESGYAIGMTKLDITLRVVLPSAFAGIAAAVALAISRAFGETMIALLASGRAGTVLSFDPLSSQTTMTTFIIASTDQDLNPGSFIRSACFTVGLVLFALTLCLNTLGNWLIRRNQAWLASALVSKADIVASSATISELQKEELVHSHEAIQNLVSNYKFQRNLELGKLVNGLFYGVCLLALSAGVVFLGVLFYENITKGWSLLDWQFLTSFQSVNPEEAGILVPLAGSLWIAVLTAVFVVPLGIGGAIFLEEYLQDSWWRRVIDVQIANLAAVPTIIYGLLGLGLFVNLQQQIYNNPQAGKNILSAALTLTLIVLPIQIISARNALQGVPNALRYAGHAVGMSKWQVIWTVVLPTAAPALISGSMLALTTAIAETAALIAVGAVARIDFTPTGLDSQFITLPVQIYYWSAAGENFQPLNAAAVLVLLSILVLINFIAVLIRNLFNRRK